MENPIGKDFKANVFRLMSGTFLSQIIVVFTLPIVTRLFSPEAFGEAAIYLAIITILTVISCGKYEMAIPLPKSDRTSANIVALCAIILTSVTLVTSLAIIVISFLNVGFFSIAYNNYFWLIPAGIFISGFYVIANNWNIRNKSYERIATANVITAYFAASSQICLGYLGFLSGIFLVIGQLFGSLIGVLKLVYCNPAYYASIWKGVSKYRILVALRRYKKFPMYNTFSSVLGVGSWRLPILLFGLFYTPYFVGLYVLGFRVFQMPVNLISKAVSQVFFQKLAEHKNEPNGKMIESITSDISGIALAPFVLLLISGSELFGFVFGKDWIEAGVYAQILAPWAYVWFLTSVFTTIFAVYERQKLHLRLNFLNFVLRVIVIVFGGLYFDIKITVFMLSALGFLIYGHRLFIIFELTEAKFLTVFKLWVRHVSYVAPIAVIAHFGNNNNLLLLLAVFLVFASVLANAVYIYRDDEFYEKY